MVDTAEAQQPAPQQVRETAPPPKTELTAELARQMVALATEAYEPVSVDPVVAATVRSYKEGDDERALKILSGEVVPYAQRNVERVLLFNLSSERDQITGEKIMPTRADEIRRFNEARVMDGAVRQYLERGQVDRSISDQLIFYLEHSSPVFRDVIGKMRTEDAAKINPFVENLLKEPAFREKIRARYVEVNDPTKRLSQEEVVRSLQGEIVLLEAKLARQGRQEQINEVQRRLEAAQANLDSLEPQRLELQIKSEEFEQLTAEEQAINQQLSRRYFTIAPLVSELRTLQAELRTLGPAEDQSRIEEINSRIGEIEGNPNYKTYLTREQGRESRDRLAEEISGLKQQLSQAERRVGTEKESLDSLREAREGNLSPEERAKLEGQLAVKRQELADAKALLEAEMIKFHRDVIHIVQDGAEGYFNEAFLNLKKVFEQEADKKAAEAEKKKTDKRTLAEAAVKKLSRLWKASETKKGIEFLKTNKSLVRQYVSAYLSGSPEAVIDKALPSNDDTGLERAGLSAEEINALRAESEDADFKREQGRILGAEALGDYFVSGGRLSRDTVIALVSSAEGQKLLNQAQSRAAEVKQALQGVVGKDVVSALDNLKGTSLEFIKANWWKFGLAIAVLLLFLGIKGVAV